MQTISYEIKQPIETISSEIENNIEWDLQITETIGINHYTNSTQGFALTTSQFLSAQLAMMKGKASLRFPQFPFQ